MLGFKAETSTCTHSGVRYNIRDKYMPEYIHSSVEYIHRGYESSLNAQVFLGVVYRQGLA